MSDRSDLRDRLVAAHTTIDLDGDVHLWDFGGSGPLIVLVHGLGGSRSNWVSVVDDFLPLGRVIVPDLIGFGSTRLDGRSSAVNHQVAMIADLIEHFDQGPAILVGNSMGGLISLLVASRHPDVVDRFVLVDAALPTTEPRITPATAMRLGLPLLPGIGPRLFERLAKGKSPQRSVDDLMKLLMADPKRLRSEDRELLIEFAAERRTMAWMTRAFADASRSIARILVSPQRFERSVQRVGAPGLIIQGTSDLIVRPSSARWLAKRRPDWPLVMLEGVGHVPQLEVPEQFSEVVLGWLDQTTPDAGAPRH
ncbi:MAG: alpha/beta hydrolase [Acidimicrobiales bacterium]